MNSIFLMLIFVGALLTLALLLLFVLLKKQNHLLNTYNQYETSSQNIAHYFETLRQDVFFNRQEQKNDNHTQQELAQAHATQLLDIVQTQFLHMEQRQNSYQGNMEKRLDALNTQTALQLQDIRQMVDEKLSTTLNKRLNDSFSMIVERLESVHKSIGEVQTLSHGIQDLQKTLSNVKTRGIWGELQLHMLLEQVLTSAQYACNVKIGKGEERVEFALILPNADETIYLPIDSKFPQESFARLQSAYETNNEKEVDMAQKAFLTAIKTEAKRITKYIAPPQTTDFAIMFLPLESLFAEVIRHGDIIEELQTKYRIMLAGPTTLLALLHSLQLGFKSIVIEQRSHEIKKILADIKLEFAQFFKVIEETQRQILKAGDSLDSVVSKSKKIQHTLQYVALDEPKSNAES